DGAGGERDRLVRALSCEDGRTDRSGDLLSVPVLGCAAGGDLRRCTARDHGAVHLARAPALFTLRMALVPGDAGPGHRTGAGGRAIDGGSVYVSSAHWHLH